jgi:hypothetical protein
LNIAFEFVYSFLQESFKRYKFDRLRLVLCLLFRGFTYTRKYIAFDLTDKWVLVALFFPSIFLSNLLALLFCSLDKAQVNLGELRVLYSWHCFMFLYEFSSGYILSSKIACASLLIVVDWSASYWDTCKYLYESVGRISCSYAFVSWCTSFVREQIKHRMKLVVCNTSLFPLINCLDTVWCFVWWFLGLVDGGSSFRYSVKCFLVCSVLEVVGSFCTYWPKIFDARSSLYFLNTILLCCLLGFWNSLFY